MTSEAGKQHNILCVGMCVLDVIHVCAEYPVEDTDKRCLSGYWQRGGNASNNCTVLRQLGASCEFLGMLSESPAFAFLHDDCRQRGISIAHCPRCVQDPPFSSVILSQATDSRTIIHSNSNFPILKYEHFRGVDLSEFHWIHFEARNPLETLRMIDDITEHNTTKGSGVPPVRISVELEKLNVDNLVLAAKAHVVFLGKDLAQFLGWQNAGEAVYGLRKKLKAEFASSQPNPVIICTWGAQGSSCLDIDDVYAHMPAMPPKGMIVDSLGAGDTFCAATIYALLELGDNALQAAVAYGNRIAGFKLSQRGYDAIGAYVKQNLD